ncbi:uncharacterized protein BX663DRAFT_347136 [Cokeromyces recurvatus]|uniref:uncharacterized protein n=1 Tax=Cokeromyces recurvatus TaxID=90255 RepID=UPI00221FDA08|nr:uncharacterized protein BX663DRAFT_347136 [Cokeromyces recurvatus]KAI7903860.1 hypothetical protein BX663DRAFT_347136 [Cokeromyces recurvatus]
MFIQFFFLLFYSWTSNRSETVGILTDLTKLYHKPFIDACQLLLNKLASCASSVRVMRNLIRSHALQMEEPFDLAVHTDLNFTRSDLHPFLPD